MEDPRAVKDQLAHTWPLFFARHGSFTAVQQQAIPAVLAGNNTLVVAATASGKTEAVVAPLLERYWSRLIGPDQHDLGLLYICPTRALVRDLHERLRTALSTTDITITMKTGDTGPVSAAAPPAVLVTTPESVDSLLTRAPRLFTGLQAVVLDEIHLFDNTPRGDHTRCLLARLERIRQYAKPETQPVQRIALSATVADPDGIARRYLQRDPTVIEVLGGREIVAHIWPLQDLTELVTALAHRATLPEPAHKSLVFCNTRHEVEQTAAFLRRHLPYYADVSVHYSNLDAQVRREVEARFAAAAVAICVSTSTLELGIDIGSVDEVVLLGAPYDLTSFMQRIGRGSRRAAQLRVLCLPRSPGEWARFEALLRLANASPQSMAGAAPASSGATAAADSSAYAFRPSILIQQMFSLLKQSPTGSIRLADVRRIAPPEVTSESIRQIIAHLTLLDYLRPGRIGEWKPGGELQDLIDRHEIYGNIGAGLPVGTAIDAYTGMVIGQTDRLYVKGTVVLFGGKPMEVVWQERSRFGLAPVAGKQPEGVLRLNTAAATIPFAVTQAVARAFRLRSGQMVTLPAPEGLWLYHFAGTVWGKLLAAVLSDQAIAAEFVNEYCLYLKATLSELPPWDENRVQQVARRKAASLANRLEMGRFQELLPPNVALSAVLGQLDMGGFEKMYRAATLVPAASYMTERLQMLADAE